MAKNLDVGGVGQYLDLTVRANHTSAERTLSDLTPTPNIEVILVEELKNGIMSFFMYLDLSFTKVPGSSEQHVLGFERHMDESELGSPILVPKPGLKPIRLKLLRLMHILPDVTIETHQDIINIILRHGIWDPNDETWIKLRNAADRMPLHR